MDSRDLLEKEGEWGIVALPYWCIVALPYWCIVAYCVLASWSTV